MKSLYYETHIAAPACKVWDILYEEYGDIGYWSSVVFESLELEAQTDTAMLRNCKSKLTNYKELITSIEVKERKYTSVYKELKSPLISITTKVSVKKRSVNTSLLCYGVIYELQFLHGLFLGWYWKFKLSNHHLHNIQDLKFYAETDMRSNRKLKMVAKQKLL